MHPWTYALYTNRQGRSPVTEWLQSLTAALQARADVLLAKAVASEGRFSMPWARHVGEAVWELRHVGTGLRLIFYVKNRTVRVLHGYIKQTDRLPPREHKNALARLADWEQQDQELQP